MNQNEHTAFAAECLANWQVMVAGSGKTEAEFLATDEEAFGTLAKYEEVRRVAYSNGFTMGPISEVDVSDPAFAQCWNCEKVVQLTDLDKDLDLCTDCHVDLVVPDEGPSL